LSKNAVMKADGSLADKARTTKGRVQLKARGEKGTEKMRAGNKKCTTRKGMKKEQAVKRWRKPVAERKAKIGSRPAAGETL